MSVCRSLHHMNKYLETTRNQMVFQKVSSVLSFKAECLKLREFLNIFFAILLKKEFGCAFESGFLKVSINMVYKF